MKLSNISLRLSAMICKVYFSPTGGTKKCLDLLCPEAIEIDLSKRDYDGKLQFSASDMLYVAMPSFGGRCPSLAIERLKSIRGNGTKAVLLAVYGNRAFEDTLIELYDTLKEQGFIIKAAASAIAEHSMIREIAAGRPDDDDRKRLLSFKASIEKRLQEEEVLEEVPGRCPYKSIGSFLKPHATLSCIRCGKCYLSCPSGAIDEMRPNLTDDAKCIGCARCIAICPEKAREYDAAEFEIVEERIKRLAEERKEPELFL